MNPRIPLNIGAITFITVLLCFKYTFIRITDCILGFSWLIESTMPVLKILGIVEFLNYGAMRHCDPLIIILDFGGWLITDSHCNALIKSLIDLRHCTLPPVITLSVVFGLASADHFIQVDIHRLKMPIIAGSSCCWLFSCTVIICWAVIPWIQWTKLHFLLSAGGWFIFPWKYIIWHPIIPRCHIARVLVFPGYLNKRHFPMILCNSGTVFLLHRRCFLECGLVVYSACVCRRLSTLSLFA